MKGQFEISPEMISNCRLTEGQIVHECIAQQLNNWNHNLGWFAKRKTPFGTIQYLWDDSFGRKMTNRKYINYLLALKEDGYELAYHIVKNSQND